MRQFKVCYSDKTFSGRPERFETRPMSHAQAEELVSMLSLMGCHDFEYKPEERGMENSS